MGQEPGGRWPTEDPSFKLRTERVSGAFGVLRTLTSVGCAGLLARDTEDGIGSFILFQASAEVWLVLSGTMCRPASEVGWYRGWPAPKWGGSLYLWRCYATEKNGYGDGRCDEG